MMPSWSLKPIKGHPRLGFFDAMGGWVIPNPFFLLKVVSTGLLWAFRAVLAWPWRGLATHPWLALKGEGNPAPPPLKGFCHAVSQPQIVSNSDIIRTFPGIMRSFGVALLYLTYIQTNEHFGAVSWI